MHPTLCWKSTPTLGKIVVKGSSPMIESIQFRNFKALRDTTLPLGRFTLIVGPNGSGKSTALQALRCAGKPERATLEQILSAGFPGPHDQAVVELAVAWDASYAKARTTTRWMSPRGARLTHSDPPSEQTTIDALSRVRIYALDANAVARPIGLNPDMELHEDGGCLAGVLDRLRDKHPERFEALNEELGRWLPEFDRILFDMPHSNTRAFSLRTRDGRHEIRASELSHGTLLALAIIALAYVPGTPPIVCFEEPDRGIHPRLLRDVQDAMYRLSHPEAHGEERDPVQVIATTHSPYFLDLYKDHPKEIVIANKVGLEARFERLIDRPDVDDILQSAPLGEVWYSGILGGVPVAQ